MFLQQVRSPKLSSTTRTFQDIPQDQVQGSTFGVGGSKILPWFIYLRLAPLAHTRTRHQHCLSGWNTDESSTQKSHLVLLSMCASHGPRAWCSQDTNTSTRVAGSGHSLGYLSQSRLGKWHILFFWIWHLSLFIIWFQIIFSSSSMTKFFMPPNLLPSWTTHLGYVHIHYLTISQHLLWMAHKPFFLISWKTV